LVISRDPAAQRFLKPPAQPGWRDHSSAATTHGVMIRSDSRQPAISLHSSRFSRLRHLRDCAAAGLVNLQQPGARSAFSGVQHPSTQLQQRLGSCWIQFAAVWGSLLQTGVWRQLRRLAIDSRHSQTFLLRLQMHILATVSHRHTSVCCLLSHAASPLPAAAAAACRICPCRSLPLASAALAVAIETHHF
jgi:hypothetical protein